MEGLQLGWVIKTTTTSPATVSRCTRLTLRPPAHPPGTLATVGAATGVLQWPTCSVGPSQFWPHPDWDLDCNYRTIIIAAATPSASVQASQGAQPSQTIA